MLAARRRSSAHLIRLGPAHLSLRERSVCLLQYESKHFVLRVILGEPVNYTWDQTENEVVVTFNLNSIIDKSCLKIDVDEELRRLQVSVQGPETSKKIIDGIMTQEVSNTVSTTVLQGR